jgi:hypothetical protein
METKEFYHEHATRPLLCIASAALPVCSDLVRDVGEHVWQKALSYINGTAPES